MKNILFILTFLLIVSCTRQTVNKVYVSGKLIHPKDTLILFSNSDTTFETSLNEQGEFKIEFDLDSAQYFNLSHAYESTAMYLKPGDVIKITLDPEQFDESISYTGSNYSSFLAEKYMILEQADFMGKVYYESDSNQYHAYVDKIGTQLNDLLSGFTDSIFIQSEHQKLEERLSYFKTNHKKIAKLDLEERMYLLGKKNYMAEFNFFSALDSLSLKDFKSMMYSFSKGLNKQLEELSNSEFVSKEKKTLENLVTAWNARKTAKELAPKAGEQAINFQYVTMEGEEVALTDLAGKLVYIDVWATWCGPCIAEIPALKQLEAEYHNQDIIFLSVSVDQDKEAWKKMVIERELQGLQLWAGNEKNLTDDYAIFGIPRFMLVGRDGRMISVDAPRPSMEEVRELLDRNLKVG